MHKKHNNMQIDHGKIAMTESVAQELRKKKMINGEDSGRSDPGRTKFAKAILSK